MFLLMNKDIPLSHCNQAAVLETLLAAILALIVLFLTACKGQTNLNQQPITFVDATKSFKKEIPTFYDGKLDLFYLLAKDKQKQLGLDNIEMVLIIYK